MEQNKRIAAMAENEDERLLLVRTCEKLERGMERETPVNTAFLTQREQALIQKLLPQSEFFGGTEGTQRSVAYYLPEYLTREDYFSGGVISCIHASFYETNALTHRDVLGALMGLGIRRDAVGDIVVGERSFFVFVLAELERYLLDNLTSAGRHHLKTEIVDPSTVEIPTQKFREIHVTVSSLRLDSVLSAAFHLSRSEAADAIRSGQAAISALTCLKPDAAVREGDDLSLRGHGKLRILEFQGRTRKDRIALNVGIFE